MNKYLADPWVLIGLSIVGLIAVYVVVFSLQRLIQEGSRLRIFTTYYTDYLKQRCTDLFSRRQSREPQMFTREIPKAAKPVKAPTPAASAAQPKPAVVTRAPVPSTPRLKSATLESGPGFTASCDGPPPVDIVKLAMTVRHRLWVTYRNASDRQEQDKLDIYSVTRSGNLRVWFNNKKKRGSLVRKRIVSWQVLNESFEPSRNLSAWARSAWWKEWPPVLEDFLNRRKP